MEEEIVIPTKLKSAAVKAISQFENAYHKDEGIGTLERTLEKKREGLATYIYRLARSARKDAKDLDETIRLFRAACEYAEEQYKAKHDVINIAKRIPAWAQFKSRIVRAMKFGLDPQNFGSERMLREALRERMQTAPPGKQQGKKSWMSDCDIHKSLQPLTKKLVAEIELIRPAKRKEAKKILEDAADALMKLVDKRRATEIMKEQINTLREAA